MSGSIIGKLFSVATWGESHGQALGAIIDGCPAGLNLSEEDIQKELDKRKPGQNAFSSSRAEPDKAHILSGIKDGITTGTPISIAIYNENKKSSDYHDIAKMFRPGHADYTYYAKYGIREYLGGGRASGRETAARVAAGAVAQKILKELDIGIHSYVISIGGIFSDNNNWENPDNPLLIPDPEAYEKVVRLINKVFESGDSLGGIIESRITGLKAGIGEPVFSKLEAELSKAIMSIGSVKGIEFGVGFRATNMTGSENNDPFYMNKNIIKKKSNNSGGVLGGISDGSDVIFRTAIKPTPSISKTQGTVDIYGNNVEISVKGRHDPVIVPRAAIVISAMTAIVTVDLLFQNMLSKISDIKRSYLECKN